MSSLVCLPRVAFDVPDGPGVQSFAFVPPCDAPDSPCEEYDGWSADVLAVLSPALKVLAARMHVIDTIIGTRSVANTFTDAPPAGSDEQLEAAAAFQAQVAAAGNWSAFNSTNESALVPTYYPLGEVRGWATDGVMRLSNDAEQLGLVFDAAVPLPDTVGNSFDGGGALRPDEERKRACTAHTRARCSLRCLAGHW